MSSQAVYHTVDLANDLTHLSCKYWNQNQEQEHKDMVAEILIGHIEQWYPEVVEHFKRNGESL